MKNQILFLAMTLLLFTSCDRRKVTRSDTPTQGVAEIVVDETLAPIIQEQVDVYESLNPNATLIPLFTSEKEAYKNLVDDSIRVLIGARELNAYETKIITERQQRIGSQRLAVDGVALITNKANTDTTISVFDLKNIFTGKVTSWDELHPKSKLGKISVVFDSPNSSMARYINDSICRGEPFGVGMQALSVDTLSSIDLRESITANEKVISYVSKTPNAIGVIGVNWVSNPSDSTNLSFIKNINVMLVSSEEVATPQNSYLPYPYQLALNKYPLKRDIYIIITDVRGGLPSGFVNFAAGDQGQRIITKAGLLPATRPMRMIQVRDSW